MAEFERDNDPGDVRPQRPRWLRFTLQGLLGLTLAVAVCLAWMRLPQSNMGDALMVAFAVLVAIGLCQEATGGRAKALGNARRLGSDDWGQFGARVAACFIGAILVGCLIVWAASRSINLRSYDDDWRVGRSRDDFGTTVTGLGIFCAYWLSIGNVRPARRTTWTNAFDLTALVAAGLFLSWVVVSETMVVSLVAMAIQGVQMAQPERWAGHAFPSTRPPLALMEEFSRRGVWAAAIWCSGVLFTTAVARYWQHGWQVRAVLFAVAIFCFVFDLILLRWAGDVLPSVAPFFADSVGTLPWMNWALAAAIIGTASLLATWCLVCSRQSPAVKGQTHSTSLDRSSWHLNPFVLLLGIVGLLWQWWKAVDLSFLFGQALFSNVWQRIWWGFQAIAHGLMEPVGILRLALLLVLVKALWVVCRGGGSGAIGNWSLEPGRFLSTWLLMVAATLLVPAVFAWYGIALFNLLGTQ